MNNAGRRLHPIWPCLAMHHGKQFGRSHVALGHRLTVMSQKSLRTEMLQEKEALV